jgi:hypothetical protein
MGGRQAVRPRPLEPVSKVRILPAQPVFKNVIFHSRTGFSLFRLLIVFRKKIKRFLARGLKATILPDRVQNAKFGVFPASTAFRKVFRLFARVRES